MPTEKKKVTENQILRKLKELPDKEQVSKAFEFPSPQEMDEFMRENGYFWDTKSNTYLPDTPLNATPNQATAETETKNTSSRRKEGNAETPPTPAPRDAESNLRVIRDNNGKLKITTQHNANDRSSTNYSIAGKRSTKTIFLSDALKEVASDFCNEFDLKQLELFEAALINFLVEHGWQDKVEGVLKGLSTSQQEPI